MRNKLLKQASHEYTPRQRFIALLFMVPIFLVLLPFIQIKLGAMLDPVLGWPFILAEPFNVIAGCLLIAVGWAMGLWSNYSQFTIGRGTPVPLMATQQLIVQPPYTYCRNPMALGAIILYLGVGILFQSYGAVIVVLLGATVLITYIKLVEEKEMEARFGQEYLDYKIRTPFIFPRFRNRG